MALDFRWRLARSVKLDELASTCATKSRRWSLDTHAGFHEIQSSPRGYDLEPAMEDSAAILAQRRSGTPRLEFDPPVGLACRWTPWTEKPSHAHSR